jgi:hypothetical protein
VAETRLTVIVSRRRHPGQDEAPAFDRGGATDEVIGNLREQGPVSPDDDAGLRYAIAH